MSNNSMGYTRKCKWDMSKQQFEQYRSALLAIPNVTKTGHFGKVDCGRCSIHFWVNPTSETVACYGCADPELHLVGSIFPAGETFGPAITMGEMLHCLECADIRTLTFEQFQFMVENYAATRKLKPTYCPEV